MVVKILVVVMLESYHGRILEHTVCGLYKNRENAIRWISKQPRTRFEMHTNRRYTICDLSFENDDCKDILEHSGNRFD